MENKRPIFAVIFGTIVAILYAYQILIAWMNAEPTSPLLIIGLVCGIGLAVVESVNIRNKK